jgi:peptide/nickel transport system substrate-binding protein
MTRARRISDGLWSLAILLAITAVATPALAQKCVRILANESEGQKESMDPAFQAALGNPTHLRAVYEPLAVRDNSMKPNPVLAESWESNKEATEWTFHLRRGVKFHSGKEFGATDVVYTFKRLLDPTLAPGAAASLSFLDANGIEAVDQYTVRFKTPKPVVELPVLLNGKFSLIVPDGAKSENLRLHEDGTGPFTQQQFVPGGAVRILKKNPNYWQAGLPKAECLELRVVAEATSRMAAITSAEADLVLLSDPATLVSLQNNPNVQIVKTPGATFVYMAMWIDTPPFNDERVRKAMKLVVDRQGMVNTALLGFGALGNDNPVPLTSPDAYRSDPIPRDVGMAKKLLVEAGHPDGLSIDLYTSNDTPVMPLLAQAYAQMALDAGIKVNVINAPADSYWDDVWLKKPFVVSYLAARPPGEALALNYLSTAKWNETHWVRKDFDSLLADASATLDAGPRRALYQKAEQMLADEGGVVGPLFNEIVSVMRKGCTGYQPNIDATAYDYRNLHCE